MISGSTAYGNQAEVLGVLKDRGPMEVCQIVARFTDAPMYGSREYSSYSHTVHMILRKLKEKGYVSASMGDGGRLVYRYVSDVPAARAVKKADRPMVRRCRGNGVEFDVDPDDRATAVYRDGVPMRLYSRPHIDPSERELELPADYRRIADGIKRGYYRMERRG